MCTDSLLYRQSAGSCLSVAAEGMNGKGGLYRVMLLCLTACMRLLEASQLTEIASHGRSSWASTRLGGDEATLELASRLSSDRHIWCALDVRCKNLIRPGSPLI